MAHSAANPSHPPLVRHLPMNSSADRLYDTFATKLEHFQKICPGLTNVTKIGADTWLWTWIGGANWKINVECIEKTKSVTWIFFDMEVPKKFYDTLTVNYQFSADNIGCNVTVKLTYPEDPVPNDYMDFACNLVAAAAASNPLKR